MTGSQSIAAGIRLCLCAALVLGPGLTLHARAQSPVDIGNPLAAQSLDRLPATRNRPLFSPDRHPPAKTTMPSLPPPQAASPPPPPKVMLYGIVVDADGATAVVRAASTDKVLRVRIGDDVGGWKVAQIEPHRIVLSLEERSASFTLFSGDHAGQSPDTGLASAVAERRPANRERLNAAGRGRPD